MSEKRGNLLPPSPPSPPRRPESQPVPSGPARTDSPFRLRSLRGRRRSQNPGSGSASPPSTSANDPFNRHRREGGPSGPAPRPAPETATARPTHPRPVLGHPDCGKTGRSRLRTRQPRAPRLQSGGSALGGVTWPCAARIGTRSPGGPCPGRRLELKRLHGNQKTWVYAQLGAERHLLSAQRGAGPARRG